MTIAGRFALSLLLAAAPLVAPLVAHADLMVPPPPGGALRASAASGALAPEQIPALAIDWFGRMERGDIDRDRLTPEYSARLTPEAITELSRYLKARNYGEPPNRAEIVKTRTGTDQSVYLVQLLFPRGDSGSMLIGIDHQNRITGLSVMTLPGD